MQKETEIFVDNSAANPNYKIEISITGVISSLFIFSPNSKYLINFFIIFHFLIQSSVIKIVLDETVVDVLDDSSIISSGLNFEIIYKGSNLINFKFKPNIEGVWLMTSSMNGESTTEVVTYFFLVIYK